MPRSKIKPAVRALAAAAAAAASALTAVPAAQAAAGLPSPAHVIVVMEENHSYSEIIGSSSAPYINSLAGQGALFSQSFAVTHPSEPNYLELFSGSTQGVTDDSCPHTFSTANLGGELLAAGDSFSGYSEGLPSDGSTVCTSGEYARKHVPWTNFTNVPAADNRVFTEFPTDYTTLPKVSFVIPNLLDDMHDGTIQQGDTWLRSNLDTYAQWAKTHNSLLVVTWDEDDSSQSNQVPTLIVGQGVTPGVYGEHITHDNVLRTVEDFYNLPYAGNSATATPITDIFAAPTGNTVTVKSPGTQAWTAGSAVSLQISASDSASGQTLSYSAAGLPAGLSIGASTGLVSGAPTTAGSGTASVTATDTTGAKGSASFAWSVGSTGGGCTAAQLLGNPGFETGTAAPWSASSGVISNSSSEPPHSGSWDAWLDGYGSTHTDTLSQAAAIPQSCTAATLTYWLHVDTAETTTTTAYDTLTVRVLNSAGTVLATVAHYSNLNAGSGYAQYSVNLGAYIGQSITLSFTGTEDSSYQTSFVLDDAALNVR